MDSTPFHLAAEARAAKGFGVQGGFVVVDGLEFLMAAVDEPVRRGTFRLPVTTTSRLKIDRVTGALPDDVWVSFHTDDGGSVDDQGCRRSKAGVLQAGGSEQRRAWVAPWLDGVPLVLETVRERDGVRLRRGAEGSLVDLELPDDEPERRCVETFRTSRWTASDVGTAVAAGSCSLDTASNPPKRKLAVLRFIPTEGSGDAGAGTASLAIRAEPLPGTQHEDRVTGLVQRSEREVLVSVVRRGRATEPARIFERDTEGGWKTLRTPVEAPAIAISQVPGGPLWVASPSEVWRHLDRDRWERVPLPSLDVMRLRRAPNISTLWVSGPDDVWLVVAHGARVLRTRRPASPVALGAD